MICLIETWLHNKEFNPPNFLDNYKEYIFNSPATRDKSWGRASGGLLVLVKNNTFTRVNVIEQANLWIILEVHTKKDKYIIMAVYLSPNLNNQACINIVSETAAQIVDRHPNHNIVSVSDFNAHIGLLNQSEEMILDSFYHVIGTKKLNC